VLLKVILAGASFKIRRGEAVGIIGASGTGKSTTLRLAAGLLAPDAGTIRVLGRPRAGLLADGGGDERLRVGMVFQNAALFDSLTVGENVGFLLHEHTALPDTRIRELVTASLAEVGLRAVERLSPSQLSGGMRKRVALARAIIPDGRDDAERLIMYDEPTAGLDPVASTVVEDLIRSLHVPSGGQPKPPPAAVIIGAGAATNGSASAGLLLPSGELASMSALGAAAPLPGSNGDGGGVAAAGGNGAVAVGPGGSGRAELEASGALGVSSYIVVTHQYSTIRRAVDRIIFLHDGRVAWQGSVKEFDTTTEPIVRQFATGSLNGPIKYL
jgi:ABC-type transporter Mla maintaining outer membrane lipid asymmetry ATPase subunit MlaF